MDLSIAANALKSVSELSYFVLFLIFIIEGAIVNYVAAFAASLGFFNVFIVYILAVLGNLIGDLIYYTIGKMSKKRIIDKYIRKKFKFLQIKKLNSLIKKHSFKSLLVIKTAPLFPMPGLIMVGYSKMPIKKFILYTLIVSIVHCGIITIIGYYSGALFSYLYEYFQLGIILAAMLIALIIGIWLLTESILKKYFKKIKNN